MDAKIYFGFLLVLLALVMSGCIQPGQPAITPTPTAIASPSPSAIPTPTLQISPSPTPNGKVWITFDPGQCTELAQFAQAGNKEGIRGYYNVRGVNVYGAEVSDSIPPGTAVCEACYVCPSGKNISILVKEEDKSHINPKGEVIPSPVEWVKFNSTSQYVCGDYGNETAFVQLRGSAVFYISAKFQSNCIDYDAYWSREIADGRQVLIVDFRSRPSGKACMKCVGMDTVEATLDLSHMSSLTSLEKIVVMKDGKTISEKIFPGAFCGGIAAFQCPTGYECKLDGTYPDAGGECALKGGEGSRCGGNMLNAPTCADGYICKLNVTSPDTGGVCEQIEGMHCGGFINNAVQCPVGYLCKLNIIADTGGVCMRNEGILTGKVSIGPICPVERIDQPCVVPPEAYTSRKLTATGPDGQEKITVIGIGSMGDYLARLPPGKYIIDLQKNGMDRSAELPATVEIKAGGTVTLDVDIDTGIR